MVATALCYASGNAGGIFGPSMFIGAMMGATVGRVAHLALPTVTADAGAYALVGMGTAFAGIIRTPLTSVIMIFEVTRDYTIIVPLMISNLTAFYISQRLQPEPIYEALAHQDGLHLPTGAFRPQAGRLRVNAAIRESPEPLSSELAVAHALDRVEGTKLGSWPVADDDGLLGMVRTTDLAAAVAAGNGERSLREFLAAVPGRERAGLAHVHGDQPLGQALARMGESGHTTLPVVSRGNARLVLGLVTLGDILKAYGVERADQLPASERSGHG